MSKAVSVLGSEVDRLAALNSALSKIMQELTGQLLANKNLGDNNVDELLEMARAGLGLANKVALEDVLSV